MTFDEVLDQVRELLQQRGRVTCSSLEVAGPNVQTILARRTVIGRSRALSEAAGRSSR